MRLDRLRRVSASSAIDQRARRAGAGPRPAGREGAAASSATWRGLLGKRTKPTMSRAGRQARQSSGLGRRQAADLDAGRSMAVSLRRAGCQRSRHTSIAAARSSSAVPTDLNSVISSAPRRGPDLAAAESEQVAAHIGLRRCAPRCERQGDVAAFARAPQACRYNTAARRSASSSASRMPGLNAPTRSRWAPGFSHAPWTTGAVDSVAQETRSASRTALRDRATAVTGRPSAASSAASASARSGRWFQSATSSIGRWLSARGSGTARARRRRPSPCGVASAPAQIARRERRGAAVRQTVRRVPSSAASGAPVAPSMSR